MQSIVATLALARSEPPLVTQDADTTLLAAGCWLLVSTAPTVINATSTSCKASSRERAELVAMKAHQLAAMHQLAVAVTITGKRVRVRFSRLTNDLEAANGGT